MTRLDAPKPNPFRTALSIRYSLAAEARRDTARARPDGRVVRTLCASSMERGAYSATWDGRDQVGRSLSNGVYFCVFLPATTAPPRSSCCSGRPPRPISDRGTEVRVPALRVRSFVLTANPVVV